MITVSNLSKSYSDMTAVDQVTFTAEAGRVTGFLGPNGAGQSGCCSTPRRSMPAAPAGRR